MLTEQENFREAEELYNKALQIDPDNATIYVHKGNYFLQILLSLLLEFYYAQLSWFFTPLKTWTRLWIS